MANRFIDSEICESLIERQKSRHQSIIEQIEELLKAGYTKEYLCEKLGVSTELFDLTYVSYPQYEKNRRTHVRCFMNSDVHLYERISLLYSDFLFKKLNVPDEYRFCYLAGCPMIRTQAGFCKELNRCGSWKHIKRRFKSDKEGFDTAYSIDEPLTNQKEAVK